MSTTFIVVVIVIASMSALAHAALRRWAHAFLRPRGFRSERTPASLGLDAEPFTLERSGAKVRGWLVRASDEPRPTVLVVHGWQSNAGDMLLWAEPLVRAGHHVVVYDALGHGESDPSEFTSLRHLREDLDLVLAWALARPETRPGIALFGHSMGGAAVILSAAAGAPVRAVVTAGAPTDPLEITREFRDGRGLPGALVVRLLRPFWQPIVREPYATLRPIERMREIRVPVLVLHGTADRQVRTHHAEQLAAANPRARLELLDGAGHKDMPSHPRYAPAVIGFLARAFAAPAAGSRRVSAEPAAD